MGIFKKFGHKLAAGAKFGYKGVSAVGLGIKKTGHYVAKMGQPISDLATLGATAAMALGQPELAAPLVGLSMGAQRLAATGRRAEKTIKTIEEERRGLQKASRAAMKDSGFESKQPPTQSNQPRFESQPHPTSHHIRR